MGSEGKWTDEKEIEDCEWFVMRKWISLGFLQTVELF